VPAFCSKIVEEFAEGKHEEQGKKRLNQSPVGAGFKPVHEPQYR
jgi:hypothetical protein